MFSRLACVICLLAFGAFSSAQSEIDSLVSRIDSLKDADYDRLKAIGDSAFVRILPIASERLKTENARPTEKNAASAAYALQALVACATPRRTRAVTALYDKTSRETLQWILFQWMASEGDPSVNRQLFEDKLYLASRNANGQSGLAVTGLVRIGDAAAVKLLIGYMKNKKTPEDFRNGIFVRLARTGSPQALDAVRRAVPRDRKLPPLSQRVDLSAKDDVVATHRDKSGVEWGLVRSSGFGCPNDLWLVRKRRGRWGDAVFTGVSEYWPMYQTGRRLEGFEAHDAELKNLVELKGWIKRFVGNPDLTKDRDGDGYSDVVEKWLGLDPGKTDSDGDGLPDGIDKNPLAARRPLDDIESALLAAFEAETAERRMEGTLFVAYPAGVKPFEVTSWSGLVLPDEGRAKPTRPEALFGFRFRLGFSSGPPVKFGKDGKTAEVQIQESGGYYEKIDVVTLRKFGNEWFPVDVRNAGWAIS
ncbi:MAG TPA: hypothetical protein VHE55_13075 [Fimbriimonadaceae bacterium]|nr:hypothetical protein [Fimbriimonadaceae bacterium]